MAESDGRRAGYTTRYALRLAGRDEIPVAAGADESQGFYRYPRFDYPAEERYWPEPVAPAPGPVEEALHLLEAAHPGILRQAKLFLMGGYVYPIRPGFPAWSNDIDPSGKPIRVVTQVDGARFNEFWIRQLAER